MKNILKPDEIIERFDKFDPPDLLERWSDEAFSFIDSLIDTGFNVIYFQIII